MTKTLFPSSYEGSRQRFCDDLPLVQMHWPQARLSSHPLAGETGLSIDWIESPALRSNEKVVIFTTGEHGIEGYVGSSMLQGFIEEYLVQLNPENTGIFLLHAINPWGMKHRRRTNRNNVDLNRNFGWNPETYNPSVNPPYDRILRLLNPEHPLRSTTGLAGSSGLLARYLSMRKAGFQKATLLGQYRHPKGIYYGGIALQEETRLLQEHYRRLFSQYGQILHLDMHTGYGPRFQMSLVNSFKEPRDSKNLETTFNYPLVVKTNPEEFYAIQGDMIDYVYTLAEQEFPDRRLYATSFEFGTYGDSLKASLRGLRSMVWENQVFWNGAYSVRIVERVSHDFMELFFPQADDWQQKALLDARQAFDGILTAEGYI